MLQSSCVSRFVIGLCFLLMLHGHCSGVTKAQTSNARSTYAKIAEVITKDRIVIAIVSCMVSYGVFCLLCSQPTLARSSSGGSRAQAGLGSTVEGQRRLMQMIQDMAQMRSQIKDINESLRELRTHHRELRERSGGIIDELLAKLDEQQEQLQ